MTDKVFANARLVGNDGRSAMEYGCSGTGSTDVGLVIEASQRTGGYGNENYVDRMVHYRFDSGPVADTVGKFGDNFIGFLDQWDDPIIVGMPKSSTLAISASGVGGDAIQMVFDVSGAAKAFADVRKRCAASA